MKKPQQIQSILFTLTLTLSALATGCSNRDDSIFNSSYRPVRTSQSLSFPPSSAPLSRWVRANSDHYWNYMRDRKELSALTRFEGVVAGDPHISNFSPVLAERNGSSSVQFRNVDLDDAGRAPLVLDFLRLLVVTKATQKKAKTSVLLNAYLEGLKGNSIDPPAELARSLRLSTETYASEADAYLDRKTQGNSFKIKPGKIESYTGPISRAQIGAFLPGFTVLDLAARAHDHGSSANSIRLYVLARDAAGKRRLFELKQRSEPAVAAYASQTNLRTWYEDAITTFWPGDERGFDQLVELPGAGIFWLREKRMKLIDVPYSSDSKVATKFVEEHAAYVANTLGKIHGRQQDGQALAAQFATTAAVNQFKALAKAAATNYLLNAREEADKNPISPDSNEDE